MPHSCAWVSRDCARVPCDCAWVPIAGSSQKRLWVSFSPLLLAFTTGHRCRHCSPQTARSNSIDTLRCYWIRNCRYYSISWRRRRGGCRWGRWGGSLRHNRQARPNRDLLLPLSVASRGVLPWPSPSPTTFAVPLHLQGCRYHVGLPLSRKVACKFAAGSRGQCKRISSITSATLGWSPPMNAL